MDDEKDRERR